HRGGKSAGAIRVSLGIVSNFSDVDRFVQFAASLRDQTRLTLGEVSFDIESCRVIRDGAQRTPTKSRTTRSLTLASFRLKADATGTLARILSFRLKADATGTPGSPPVLPAEAGSHRD